MKGGDINTTQCHLYILYKVLRLIKPTRILVPRDRSSWKMMDK